MALQFLHAYLDAGGRSWSVDYSGTASITRRYFYMRDPATIGTAPADEELATVTGLPAIGAVHPVFPLLYVSGYSFAEKSSNEKSRVDVTVTYSRSESSGAVNNSPPPGQDIEAVGWSDGSVSRDVTNDVKTGAKIVNSAGDPFSSVPQVDHPSPVWRKVVKTVARKSYAALVDKINSASMTLGGVTCAAHTVRLIGASEEALWNDPYGYKYRYTISFQYLSNKVPIGATDTPLVEIGWDLAVIDTGLRVVDSSGKLIRPTEVVEETKQPQPITEPVPLNGRGAQKERDDVVYTLRFQVYEEDSFADSDLTSETPTFIHATT